MTVILYLFLILEIDTNYPSNMQIKKKKNNFLSGEFLLLILNLKNRYQ